MDKKVLSTFVLGLADKAAALNGLTGKEGGTVGRSLVYAALARRQDEILAEVAAATGKPAVQAS